tara:strand:- start:197357 stop:198058 length:702 start_codon:yes stop_codon:yes gene_type:complete
VTEDVNSDADTVDYRTRIGQERRQRTYDRLVEAGTMVFADQGVNGTVIDHVVRRAGVSRGTFYNYFDTIDDVLVAAKRALAREIVSLIFEAIDEDLPPAERLAYGVKAFVELARAHPLFLEFTARIGRHAYGFGQVLDEVAPCFVSDSMMAGDFCPMPQAMVTDILEVGTLALMRRIVAGEDVDVPAFVAAILRMLGVAPEEATRIAALPVVCPVVPKDALLAQSNAAWTKSH